MRLDSDLKWLAPYLEYVGAYIPLEKIKGISYYKNRKGQKQNHKAITYRLTNNKDFKIFIRTSCPKEKRVPIDRDTQEDVLFYLAHELAHLENWEHDENHFFHMANIFRDFAVVLTKIGFEEKRNKIAC